MIWLSVIPKPVLLIVAILCAVTTGVQTVRLAAARHTLTDLRETVLLAREQRAQQAENQRETERLRARVLAGVIDDAHTSAVEARRDAVALDRVANRLRNQLSAMSTDQDRRDSATSESRTPASGAGLVFTKLLSGADERLRSCGTALDESRIAGLACERAYDSLRMNLMPENLTLTRP